MSPGADDKRSPYSAVDHPLLPGPFHFVEWFPFLSADAGAFEKIMVELAAADPVADRPPVMCFHRIVSHAAGAEAGDGLEDAPLSVFPGIQFQLFQNSGSDPAAADLVTRKLLLVEDQYV